MRRALSVLLLLACAAANGANPPRRVWLRLDGTPAVVSDSQALEVLAAGGRIVRYASQDSQAVPVLGLLGGGDVPTPPPADPLAALRQTLTAAYQTDPDPSKAEHVKALGELYGEAAVQVRTSDKAPAAFLAAMRQAANGLIGDAALPKVRDATAAYLVKLLPTDPAAAWTAESRATAAREFGRLATVLGGLK